MMGIFRKLCERMKHIRLDMPDHRARHRARSPWPIRCIGRVDASPRRPDVTPQRKPDGSPRRPDGSPDSRNENLRDASQLFPLSGR